ncbi:MAG TPA: signal peptidase I [Pyrinomonadaceae bacterium]
MRTFVVCIILALCIAAIGCKGLAYRTSTDNMLPTISQNDMAVTAPGYYNSNPIERFDIVVFQAPEFAKKIANESGDVRFIKRIIGLPNERIEIKDNKIFINDKLLDEPFDKIVDDKDEMKNFPAMVIPKNEYFLLGDNRPQSMDSRYWKPPTIRKEDIYSKIVEIRKDFYKDK